MEIDGRPVDLLGAGVRAVIGLALMQNKGWFSVTDFNDLLYGSKRTKGDPANEFTTAIRAVRRLLPQLGYKSDYKERRSISGVFFDVAASDAQLKEQLARMSG